MPYRFNDFNNPENTTSIAELNSNDVIGPNSNVFEESRPNTDKFIRKVHSAPYESGMNRHPYPVEIPNREYAQQTRPEPFEQGHEEHFSNCGCSSCRFGGRSGLGGDGLMCPAVFAHIANCPVCKKMYGGRCDSTVYIIIILVLLVACGLLFRKAFPN